MKKRFTLLITCMLLLVCNNIYIGGQALIGTLGSGTDGNGQNVNNAFGAGESSVVRENSQNQVQAYGKGGILGDEHVLLNIPLAIQLGGDDVKNIVIHSYNSSGVVYSSYWKQTKIFTYTRTWTATPSRIWKTRLDNGGSGPGYEWYTDDQPTIGNWFQSSSNWGSTGNPYADPSIYVPGYGNLDPPNYSLPSGDLKGDAAKFSPYGPAGSEEVNSTNGITFCNNRISVGTSTPYVAEKFPSDDGVSLVQLNTVSLGTHAYVYNDATLNYPASDKDAPIINGIPALDPYKRPTTVAVNREITLTDFLFKDIPWYYTTHNASYSTDTCYTVGSWTTGSTYPPNDNNSMGVSINWNNPPTDTPYDNSPNYVETAQITYTHTYSIEITAYNDRVAGWNTFNHAGGYVNGAIQILDGADICLTGGIMDNSSNSDVFLAFPNQDQTFSLKMGGDFDAVDMVHVDGSHNIYYTDAEFPTLSTPNLLLYNNSVLGVNGNYHPANPIVHTSINGADRTPTPDPGGPSYTVTAPTTTAYSSPNKGIIEVGPGTTGQDKFFIYSGGTIRNFWSSCLADPCDSIRFNTGNTPTFIFNTDADSLMIYNNGDCCEASIHFADDAAVGNLTAGSGTETGINQATAAGPLRIWANKGHIWFNAPATGSNLFKPKMGNDIDIIAQNSYIYTKDFEYDGTAVISGTYISDLLLNANGGCDNCPDDDPGSYILMDGAVSTKNANIGTTTVKSDNHYVEINGDFSHTGVDGNLLISGHTKDTIGGIVKITRDGTGDDKIVSPGGHVAVTGPFTYTQTPANPSGGLFVWGQGDCSAVYCGESVGGYVLFENLVTTMNAGTGTTEIISDHSYIKMNDGFSHTGVSGSLLVTAPESAVEILGIAKNLDIKRNDDGSDEISGTQVHVEGTTTYTQALTQAPNTINGLLINGTGIPCTPYCNYIGGFVSLEGDVKTTNTSEGTTKILSNADSVFMGNGFFHKGVDGNMTVSGELGVHVGGKNVEIERNNTGDDLGNDSIRANNGSIIIDEQLTYDQTGGNQGISGYTFNVWAKGEPCKVFCDDVTYKGGFISVGKEVTVKHAGDGTTLFRSELDTVSMRKGYFYTGVDGDMTVSGELGVHVWGDNVEIKRNNITADKGNDKILANDGNIYIEKDLQYIQTGLIDGYEFWVWANGGCADTYCGPNPKAKGGAVVIDGNARIEHAGNGTTLIQSKNDSVAIHNGYLYTGVNGNMTVNGYSGVELTGDVVTINRTITQTTDVPAIWDSIVSPAGQVHVEQAFTYYLDPGTNAVRGGLLIEASKNGYVCDDPECGSYGGYVWMQSSVVTDAHVAGVTPANDEGSVTIRSNGHFVRMDNTYTHRGQNGNLLIEALGICSTTCTDIWNARVDVFGTGAAYWEEGYLYPTHSARTSPDLAYTGRPDSYNGGGYVWIQGDVDIHMAADQTPEGNDTIRSKEDIVQFDQTFNFSDNLGSNLMIDGDKGIRTIGATSIIQNDYDPQSSQGSTHYLSKNGFVDFWDNFNYTANSATATGDDRKSALDIDGSHRVEFLAPVAINMGNTNGTTGHADIYSENGWVDVQSTFTFDGTDGDLITWAEGTKIGDRSCIDSAHIDCDKPRGGFVHYNGDVDINYTNIDYGRGKTWIRSLFDDVKIDRKFTYTSQTGPDNGLFLMQSGQDIYGISDRGPGLPETEIAHGTSIEFNQAGEQGIMMQAKKTIHLVQDLTFDRAGAKEGDITMSAGYTGFVNPSDVNSIAPKLRGVPWDETDIEYTPNDYQHRYACQSILGGDIWFEGDVHVDLSGANTTDNTIKTTMRAWKSLYIDQNFTYDQGTGEGGDVFLFAHTGNIEAIDGSVIAPTPPENSQTGTAVEFNITNQDNTQELRLQAGNQPDGECLAQLDRGTGEWKADEKEFEGNILFNKPFTVNHGGLGYTILSASRDIENQYHAPFTFNYDNSQIKDSLIMTAGRHIETHNVVKFNYPHNDMGTDNENQIVMRAGRLASPYGVCAVNLCKTIELGTALTGEFDATLSATDAYNPFTPNAAPSPAQNQDNEFAKGGAGHGSILLFDSAVFNYDGKGGILMTALNGNIESDPYLHKKNKNNAGYDGAGNIHNAQLTFNHGGAGKTRLEAIDIKLHDKLSYEATQKDGQLKNGQFYMAAFDSILTRNIKYVNPQDTGSVFITTAKYKAGANCDDTEYDCDLGGPGIHQGHIVLGYGADDGAVNENDSIIFDYNSGGSNNTVLGGNIHILAGFEGFENNKITGRSNNAKLFAGDKTGKDLGKRKGFGGNITFDYMEFYMPAGNGRVGGFTEIRTPNGNIWGKDSILYHGINGDLLVDAGLGSADDGRAILWDTLCPGGQNKILNTIVPGNCDDVASWRTGNIMMKGAALNFLNPVTNTAGSGDAIFRTREGFIDTYDAFTVSNMSGDLLKYAGMDNPTEGRNNNYGDVSERDFSYAPATNSGSVFFGADDNIMLNYGNSNFYYTNYGKQTGLGYPGDYDVTSLPNMFKSDPRNAVNTYIGANPYYYTSYEGYIAGLATATFDVNGDGYLFYRHKDYTPRRNYHSMYRGCIGGDCSGYTGNCATTSNGARNLTLDYSNSATGGFASVASNYIDVFTGFTYHGGAGSAMGAVPGMGSLHGESVAGYGLYMKSQFNGTSYNYPEKRRATCEDCGQFSSFPMEGETSRTIPEMTYIGFHDDARIHTHRQKSLLEAPVIEFFGHAEMDAETNKGGKTNITLKADSLIFHDSVIFAGHGVELKPYTTDATQRANDMRYGVINDKGRNRANYSFYGPAIEMEDRNLPVLELGYQRCNEPNSSPNSAPNIRSLAGKEQTPTVGGDVIVAFKYGYAMPMFNTVVANHARISFISDSLDNMPGGEFVDAFIRTDLLRIRNKVEFYTDPAASKDRRGKFVLATPAQMDDKMVDPGMFTRHLHMEPGSELSLPGEDSLTVIPTTVVGGYGNIHENVMVKANGILAPGFASLMEGDCQTPKRQGKLTVHNLQMEKDAVLRLSISNRNCIDSPDGPIYCTQTDTIVVQDTVYFTDGRVPIVILPETETLDPGCYLFMVYGDSTGVSQEYVKNFVLKEIRYGDNYFSLYFGERGKVYLCVTSYPIPEVQRWIDILEVPGVTTVPGFGRSHVFGHQNFTFTARYSGSPLKISAKGFYSGNIVDLDHTSRLLDDGSYQYTIYQVVEPWTVYIGPDPRSEVSNEGLPGQRIWTYKNTLYINVAMDDIVSIYNLTGVLYQKVEIPAGTNKFTLERGMYIVTLKDGSVHKIVIK